jgi:hypothetical protein
VSGYACVHCARVVAAEQRDARKLLQHQQTAPDHPDDTRGLGEWLDNADQAEVEEANAEARERASLEELM